MNNLIGAFNQSLIKLDQRLAIGFGTVILIAMLSVMVSSVWMTFDVIEKEETQLITILAKLVSKSVSRVGFAGKYQTRILIKELIDQNPQLELIYVVDEAGQILAHSQSDLNDLKLDMYQLKDLIADSRAIDQARTLRQGGNWYRQIVQPYSGGFNNQLKGYLVMHVKVDDTRQSQVNLVLISIGLVLSLGLLSVWVVIHLSRKMAKPVRDFAEQFSGILRSTPMFIFIQSRDGSIQGVSEVMTRTFPLIGSEMHVESFLSYLPEELEKEMRAHIARVFQYGEHLGLEYQLDINGANRSFLLRMFPVVWDQYAKVESVCSMALEITERRTAETGLHLAKKAIDSAAEGILITDHKGRIEEVNPAFIQLTGFELQTVIGKLFTAFFVDYTKKSVEEALWRNLHHFEKWEVELLCKSRTQDQIERMFPVWVSMSAVKNEYDKAENYVVLITDLSDKKEDEKQLEYFAYYDPLTKLPNRMLFKDQLKVRIASSRRQGTKLALLLIDLDNFKTINDKLGHAHGDELLQIIASRLLDVMRESDTVARLGGDEFTVILNEFESAEDVMRVASDIINSISEPTVLMEQHFQVGASIGIAMFPEDGKDGETLLRHADMGMYHAKETGKNQFQFFSFRLQDRLLARVELEHALRNALDQDQFVFFYQPKVNLATGKMVGAEALIRWNHPERGLVAPGGFIQVAEETGLIIPIARKLVSNMCSELAYFIESMPSEFSIAINVSAREFEQADFVDFIRELVESGEIAAHRLELEITESMVMENVEQAIETMHNLKNIGVKLAIDDFGTGYSSLNYLKSFPIDTLKIDRSFVSDLPEDSQDLAIVKAVVYMAKKLDLEVVAEGMETPEQGRCLYENGCTVVQGYYFSRPVPFVELEEVEHLVDDLWCKIIHQN